MYVLVFRNREPLSYGEESIGTKTLVKRVSILLPEEGSEPIQIPMILGNGIRGILRDIITQVFLERVAKVAGKGKEEKKEVEVDARLLLLMMSGGTLKEREGKQRAVKEKEGVEGEEKERAAAGEVAAGVIKNIREKVNLLPPLSMMGFALANVMIPSKIKVSLFYPVCYETYNLINDLVDMIRGSVSTVDFEKLKQVRIKDLVGEVQMMRKDDKSKLATLSIEGVNISNISEFKLASEEEEEKKEAIQMRFQREYVVSGTVFIGYISEIFPLTPPEKELLALGINRMKEIGVGGAIARGFGSFSLEYNGLGSVLPSGNKSILEEFIEKNLNNILEILRSNPEEWLKTSV